MSRITDYLLLIDDPRQPPLSPGHPDDEVLNALLVHLAAEDGVVKGDELALLRRVRSDLEPDAVLAWANEVAARPLALGEVAAVARLPEDRWNLLRIAARMVALDGDRAEAEVGRLQQLTDQLELPAGAARQVLGEVVAPGGEVSEEQLRNALRHMWWDVLLPRHEALTGPIAATVPGGSTPLCSVLLEDEEVAGLYLEGLAARFDSGPAFVAWKDIHHYTRVPVPGAAFHLRTVDGRDLAMTPPQLRDLGALVDLAYGRKPTSR